MSNPASVNPTSVDAAASSDAPESVDRIEIPSESVFLRRLAIITLCLLLILTVIYILREFKSILQPLFIAIFVSYIIVPAHRWVVNRGVPSMLAYVALLVFLLVILIGLGGLLYGNIQELMIRLPQYEVRLKIMMNDALSWLGLDADEQREFMADVSLFDPISTQEAIAQARAFLGSFFNFFGALAITAVYLIFVVVERGNFSRRIFQALTAKNATRVMRVSSNINTAISQYLAVKMLSSFLGGVFTVLVLALFNVDFFITWGILAFVLNFIPYLGSLIATLLPVLLSMVQLGLWQALVIALLLVAMQQFIGVVLEPRLAGTRLNVSPMLILLALSFWGIVWGIVGMILAVPLLVTIKIILDNIKETRPIAALMSNLGPTPLPDRGAPER